MEEENAQYKEKEKVCLVRKDKKEVIVACLLERREKIPPEVGLGGKYCQWNIILPYSSRGSIITVFALDFHLVKTRALVCLGKD